MSVSTEIQISVKVDQMSCIEFHYGSDFTSVTKTGVRLLGAVKFF